MCVACIAARVDATHNLIPSIYMTISPKEAPPQVGGNTHAVI